MQAKFLVGVAAIDRDHAPIEPKARRAAEGRPFTRDDLHAAIMTGAVDRVRPKMMTAPWPARRAWGATRCQA
ncbi:MAG: hypothetical protein K2Z80_33605 [Xanthobacteraceae bacterium]|nr:hypothetical protein [Xanthobacteraceae bacterium]